MDTFEDFTRALLGYVTADATCPRCQRSDECEPWCRFRDQHASREVDRLQRARVAVHTYHQLMRAPSMS